MIGATSLVCGGAVVAGRALMAICQWLWQVGRLPAVPTSEARSLAAVRGAVGDRTSVSDRLRTSGAPACHRRKGDSNQAIAAEAVEQQIPPPARSLGCSRIIPSPPISPTISPKLQG